ncbi:MAG: tRNA (adenosine(37)-N6)-dimethylallyltransferase MiaA [Saprospiraceae bacterium]
MKHLIVVAGATASGKTSLAIRLAKHFKTVIISADSRQFYREMNIGTAKPTPDELAEAKHYFIDNLSIHDEYSVGQYERDTIALLEKLYQNHDVVIMAGGSGLFIQAVCEGLDKFPDVPESTRAALIDAFEKDGIEPLQQELQVADPDYYATVDTQNAHRLIRALEICRTTGKPYSSFRTAKKANRAFSPIKIALNWERSVLYDRINLRVDLMLEAGLEAEAKSLLPNQHLNSLQTVGYQELFDFFNKKIDQKEAIRLIKRNSRRYAKRQLTWLRRSGDIHFFEPSNQNKIVDFLEKKITN